MNFPDISPTKFDPGFVQVPKWILQAFADGPVATYAAVLAVGNWEHAYYGMGPAYLARWRAKDITTIQRHLDELVAKGALHESPPPYTGRAKVYSWGKPEAAPPPAARRREPRTRRTSTAGDNSAPIAADSPGTGTAASQGESNPSPGQPHGGGQGRNAPTEVDDFQDEEVQGIDALLTEPKARSGRPGEDRQEDLFNRSREDYARYSWSTGDRVEDWGPLELADYLEHRVAQSEYFLLVRPGLRSFGDRPRALREIERSVAGGRTPQNWKSAIDIMVDQAEKITEHSHKQTAWTMLKEQSIFIDREVERLAAEGRYDPLVCTWSTRLDSVAAGISAPAPEKRRPAEMDADAHAWYHAYPVDNAPVGKRLTEWTANDLTDHVVELLEMKFSGAVSAGTQARLAEAISRSTLSPVVLLGVVDAYLAEGADEEDPGADEDEVGRAEQLAAGLVRRDWWTLPSLACERPHRAWYRLGSVRYRNNPVVKPGTLPPGHPGHDLLRRDQATIDETELVPPSSAGEGAVERKVRKVKRRRVSPEVRRQERMEDAEEDARTNKPRTRWRAYNLAVYFRWRGLTLGTEVEPVGLNLKAVSDAFQTWLKLDYKPKDLADAIDRLCDDRSLWSEPVERQAVPLIEVYRRHLTELLQPEDPKGSRLPGYDW